MPRTEIGVIRTDSIVKTEGPNRYSRDEATAPAAIGPLEVGTVMARGADGTLAALTTTATPGQGGGAANCVLLEAVETGNTAQRVVVLTRHAEIPLQELRWPAAYAAAEQDAAIAALRDLGIVTRKGV